MSGSSRPTAVFAMRPGLQHRLFAPPVLRELDALVAIDSETVVTDWESARMTEVEIVLSGWGAPRLTPSALAAMPRLRLLAHAAGSIRALVTDDVWQRPIRVTSAADANAVPVAEYSLAAILMALKQAPSILARYAAEQRPIDLIEDYPSIGSYRATIGIIGASTIGRAVVGLVHAVLPSARILVFDPFLDDMQASSLHVESVLLDRLLHDADVVSLHAPDLPSTRHMLGAAQFAAMRTGSTFINTARPALVDQDALLDELRAGRLHAWLDVTEPEPLPSGHPLYALPNVTLSPHLAGAQGTELLRLGEQAAEEVRRLVHHEAPLRAVTVADLAVMA